jgi:beta-glucosidase-like glycosyl hydrolase
MRAPARPEVSPSWQAPHARRPAPSRHPPAAFLAASTPARRAGIVLLKNRDIGGGARRLPLSAGALKKVVVMGPHAKATEVLLGNYYGVPARRITSPLEALQARPRRRSPR